MRGARNRFHSLLLTTNYLSCIIPPDIVANSNELEMSRKWNRTPQRARSCSDAGRMARLPRCRGSPRRCCAGLGSLAAGWLYDGLHHYEVAFWLCAAAFLLAAIGIALAPRPKEQHAGSGQAGSVREEVAMGGSAIEQ